MNAVRDGIGEIQRQLLKSQELLRAQHRAFRAAQARLRLSHARYLELFARAPVAYITFSTSGLVLDLNAKAAELLASPPAVLRGLPFASRGRPRSRPICSGAISAVAARRPGKWRPSSY